MNTPKKAKPCTERTRAKDRTAKNKKGLHGKTQQSDISHRIRRGEGIKPNHEARSISREGLNAIFTRSDVFLTVPEHDSHTHTETVEPDDQNREDRRLNNKFSKRRRTILNSIFRTRGDK